MKKFLAFALVLALCVGVLPFGALGATSDEMTEADAVIQIVEEWIAEDESSAEEDADSAEEPEQEQTPAAEVDEVPTEDIEEAAPAAEPEEALPEEDIPEEPDTEDPASEEIEVLAAETLSADEQLKLDSVGWTQGTSYYSYTAVYCTDPVNNTYQRMNIYVPAEYFSGGTVNGYTAETAPIILENNCGGWNSSPAGSVNSSYISAGYVFVSCGARSRDAENGTGKAPAPIVDLKSAVRWLRLNDDVIPGDKDKIISIGSSGGGEMSSVLGASGNVAGYYPYLYEIGAAGIEYDEATDTYTSTISDAIYGCMCYCPIGDLENADIAYAWFFKDSISTQSAFQAQLVQDLAYAYAEYINALGLKNAEGTLLTFDYNSDGTLNLRSGTYYEQILQNISDALNSYLDAEGYSGSYSSAEAYIASLSNTGKWLTQNTDGSYSVTDLDAYATAMNYRSQKGLLGFDTWTASAEGNAFGTADEDGVHFSASVAAVLEENYAYYSTLSGFSTYKDNVDAFIKQANRSDIQNQTYLMNATAIMVNAAYGNESADVAAHWRIRTGTSDSDTTYNVSYGIGAAAAMNGADVDYTLVWLMAHGSDEGTTTGTFGSWVNEISGNPDADDPSSSGSSSGPGGSSGEASGDMGSSGEPDTGDSDDSDDSGDTGGNDDTSGSGGSTSGDGDDDEEIDPGMGVDPGGNNDDNDDGDIDSGFTYPDEGDTEGNDDNPSEGGGNIPSEEPSTDEEPTAEAEKQDDGSLVITVTGMEDITEVTIGDLILTAEDFTVETSEDGITSIIISADKLANLAAGSYTVSMTGADGSTVDLTLDYTPVDTAEDVGDESSDKSDSSDDSDDSTAPDDSAVTPEPSETETPAADADDEASDHMPGDIDGNGKVNISDVQALLKYVNGQNVSVVEAALDTSGDGTVNISDVQVLLKFVNGQDVTIY